MATELDNCVYRIWDRFGFQEGETGWVIEIHLDTDPPDPDAETYFGEVILTDEETESLKIEAHVEGWDMWDRDITGLSWAQLVAHFSPSDALIERTLEVIATGPHEQDW